MLLTLVACSGSSHASVGVRGIATSLSGMSTGLGGVAASESSARKRVSDIAVGIEEVGAVATLLAVGVFLGISSRAITLGTCSDTFVGISSLVSVWARNLPALSDAASVVGVTLVV